jgi:hypothetical protein
MSSTSGAVADSIASQLTQAHEATYAAVMDDLIDDAARMESQRDAALAQMVGVQGENRILKVQVLALAQKLDDARALLATLGERELAGETCGPAQLLATGWVNPRPRQDFTQAHADQMLEEIVNELMESPEMQ